MIHHGSYDNTLINFISLISKQTGLFSCCYPLSQESDFVNEIH